MPSQRKFLYKFERDPYPEDAALHASIVPLRHERPISTYRQFIAVSLEVYRRILEAVKQSIVLLEDIKDRSKGTVHFAFKVNELRLKDFWSATKVATDIANKMFMFHFRYSGFLRGNLMNQCTFSGAASLLSTVSGLVVELFLARPMDSTPLEIHLTVQLRMLESTIGTIIERLNAHGLYYLGRDPPLSA